MSLHGARKSFTYIEANKMAAAPTGSENVDMEDENVGESTAKKAAKHDSVGAADLEKVTDFVEEEDISSQRIDDVSCDLFIYRPIAYMCTVCILLTPVCGVYPLTTGRLSAVETPQSRIG